MVAQALITRATPRLGERPPFSPPPRRPARVRGAPPLAEEIEDLGDDLTWSEVDATAPLLEALDRIRTITPDRPGESDEAKALRARRAYQETNSERLARMRLALD